MTPLVRNRLILVGALLVAGSGFAVLSFGKMGENLVYYWSPAEMISQGEKAFGPTIRLGGVVKPGSIQWNAEHTNLNFQIATDHKPEAVAVTVHSTEVPPAMFREGIGVVVEGTFDKSQVFSSNRLMVNHSNEYRAPKPGEEPREWKESVKDPSATATARPQ
jgi:cytochrome c-type biogenesis protein CcmE